MDASGGAWWQRRGYVAFLIILSIVPLLWPSVPPLSDLPSHMASYAVSVADTGSPLNRYYSFHWQMLGNLGIDLPVVPLARLIGVEAATKLLVLTIPLLMAIGIIAIAREAHGRLPATTAFAVPLAYNYFFLFGFVNFSLAMALTLPAFALWLRWGRTGLWWQRAIAFIVIAPVIWIVHAIGWGLLCILCGSAELTGRLLRREKILGAAVRSGLACVPLLAALLPMAFQAPSGGGGMKGWLSAQEIVKWVLALLRDRWMVFDLAGLVPIVLVLGLALFRRTGLRFQPRLLWPGLALVATYILAPASIAGSSFVSQRVAPYAAMLLLIAIDTGPATSRAARGWALAASAFLLVRMAGLTLSAATYDREWKSQLAALDHVREGSAVAVFSPYWCRVTASHWYNPRIDHLGGFAAWRRNAFTNTQWTLNGLQLLRVRYPEASSYQSDPSHLVTVEDCTYSERPRFDPRLASLPRDAFDYVWLIHIPRQQWPHDPLLEPVWSSSESALYRIVKSQKTR